MLSSNICSATSLEAPLIRISSLKSGALAVLFAAACLVSAAHAESGAAQLSVIELFTSQGCSSCPAADRLLQDLAKKPGIIAMSFPVTYWDYLGWKDTLARPENSQRQRVYAATRGDGEVYTPQVVVNGLQSCVGSNLAAIEAAVRSTGALLQKAAVPLKAHRDEGRLIIEAGSAPDGSQYTDGKIWVASVTRSANVAIKAGENVGRKITYTNVVRKLTDAGEWKGAPTAYAVPIKSALQEDGDMVVVFLQAEKLGPILAATRVDL
jgi:hypothetical protein